MNSSSIAPAIAQASIEDLTATQKRLAEQQISEAKSAAEKKAAEQQLQTVQSELVKAARQSQEIERKISELMSQKRTLQKEQSYVTERILEDQGLSTALFRSLYKGSKLPPYGLYFNHGSKSDIINRMIALNATLPAVYDRVDDLRDELDKIKKLQNDINQVMSAQKNEQENLKKSSTRLQTLVKEREKLYQQASTSYQKQAKEVQSLQQKAKDLEELIAQLRPAPRPGNLERTASAPARAAPPIPAGDDKFLPVVGTIKINYGQPDEIGAKNQGIIFSTAENAVAIAPMAGRVVFAGPFQNFKRLLIIEHNGGYHSLVAGLDHIDTSVGVALQAGEPIGRIERQAGANGRVYYELRKNGKPVNPGSVLQLKAG